MFERPDLFPAKEDPAKGEFIGCPAGWGCSYQIKVFLLLLKWKRKDGS